MHFSALLKIWMTSTGYNLPDASEYLDVDPFELKRWLEGTLPTKDVKQQVLERIKQ